MLTVNEAVWILLGFMILRLILPTLGLILLSTWLQRRHPGYPYS